MSIQLRCDEIVIIGTVLTAQKVTAFDHNISIIIVHQTLTNTQNFTFFSRTFKNNLIHTTEWIFFCDTKFYSKIVVGLFV